MQLGVHGHLTLTLTLTLTLALILTLTLTLALTLHPHPPAAAVPPPAPASADLDAGVRAATPPRGGTSFGRSGAAAGAAVAAAGTNGCAARASAQRTASKGGKPAGSLPRLGSTRTGRERQRDGATLRVSGERPTRAPFSKGQQR